MPLVGLEEIEWDRLNHAYGSAEDIPDLLRALDAAETKEEFDKILDELWNNVNHQGSIYEATPVTVKFILQIIQNTSKKFRVLNLLICLGELLRVSQHRTTSNINRFALLPITHLRFHLESYDTIAEGLDYYLQLLSDDDEELRLGGIFVLFYLADQADKTLTRLAECISNTDDEWIQACGVWAYANIARLGAGYKVEPHLQELLKWIGQYKNKPLIRYSAAFGYLGMSQRTIPDTILDLVVEAISSKTHPDNHRDRNSELYYMESELSPFQNMLEWISNFAPNVLPTIIPRLKLSAFEAHLYIRELVNNSFERIGGNRQDDWFGLEYISPNRIPKEFNYAIPTHNRKPFQRGKPITDFQRLALQTVVDCEPFWEIPTNLFSFFYGLPDDREELRKLIEK